MYLNRTKKRRGLLFSGMTVSVLCLHFYCLTDFVLFTNFVGHPIILPRENESVLLGAAILGAVAAKKYNTVQEAMKALNAAGQVYIFPSSSSLSLSSHG